MKDEKTHCPEVEQLMSGRMPFVTRHGITIVAAVVALTGAALLCSGGAQQQLMEDIVKHTVEQIKSKI